MGIHWESNQIIYSMNQSSPSLLWDRLIIDPYNNKNSFKLTYSLWKKKEDEYKWENTRLKLPIHRAVWWEPNQVLIHTAINAWFICSAAKLLHVPVKKPIKYSLMCPLERDSCFLPGLIVFSEAEPASELSEGMLWMDDRGISVSVLVSHVDSVSLVQLSRYRGSRASVLLPPQPIARPQGTTRFQLHFSSERKRTTC